MPHEVFISYRKSISQSQAQILQTKVDEAFGIGTAFLDTSNLETGKEWAKQLKEKLAQAKVVIVVIGKAWTSCCFQHTDIAEGIQEGQRRIDHPEDWVCLEIEEGYKAKKAFPIYMGGATLGSVKPNAMPLSKPNIKAFFADIQSDIVISNSHKPHEFEPVFTAIEKKGLQRIFQKTIPTQIFNKTDLIQLERSGLKEQAQVLIKKLNFIRKARITETDAAKQFQYDIDIEEMENKLKVIKEQLD